MTAQNDAIRAKGRLFVAQDGGSPNATGQALLPWRALL